MGNIISIYRNDIFKVNILVQDIDELLILIIEDLYSKSHGY